MSTLSSATLARRAHRAARHHVLSEVLFKRFLLAERRRANRANRPAVMLVVAPQQRWWGTAETMWNEVAAALTACIRETDVVGWMEHKGRIGVILHDITPARAANPAALELRMRQEFARHIEPTAVARVSISVHVDGLWPPEGPPSSSDDDPFAPRRAPSELATKTVYDGVKRFLDILGSLALLGMLLPLLLVIAALVKLKSPGPVLFGQVRIGRMMKPFTMLKFRTMHVNADPGLHFQFVSQFIHSGGQPMSGTNGVFKIVNDPRVTPIGRLLRRASLDELPQLLNVLRGDMSLVGPRPPLPYEVDQYKPWHTRRVIDVKPGLTGLWQVGGRSRTSFDDMVRLDLQYAKRCSLWTDIKILLATPRAVVSGKGAC
jgi:lipopolysaccharide/colanic/teichoic acid biosynthesis glycosyltransferase